MRELAGGRGGKLGETVLPLFFFHTFRHLWKTRLIGCQSKMLPDRRPYTHFVFWIVAAGAFIIAMAQVGLLAWRLVDGWLGPF